MEEKEKEKIIDDAHETIDTFSNFLKDDGSNVKEHVNKLNDSDLKFLRELEELIHMFKKPFWKVALWIILFSSVFNILYLVGYLIGKFIATLGI